MADREKVMQWLKICANGCKDGCPYEYKNLVYRVECKAELMSDALDLLREQEPVKPIDENFCDYYLKHTMGRCGHCRAPLPAIEGLRSKFCWMCGRKVKWDA